MHDVLNVLVTLIFVAVLIALVVTSPKWVSAKIKRERARRAYYDSPYEPGDPAWRRQVPPWTSEGIDEQPRPVHQHHQAPGVSSKPEPHHHSPPSDPPSKHHHS